MSLLITQVQRYGSNHFYGDSYQKERFGVDVYISYLNKKIGEVSAENDKYYQTLPNIFNVSSIFGLPLYVAKNHFMNCTEWLDRVDIYDEQMNIHYQETSRWDDSFILVEVTLSIFSPTQESPSNRSSTYRTTTFINLINSTTTQWIRSYQFSQSAAVATSPSRKYDSTSTLCSRLSL